MGIENYPGFLQNETYSAEIARRTIMAPWARGATIGSVVGGLIGNGDFLITYGGSGLGVNVATGEAIVPGSSVSTQSGYYMRGSSITALTPAAANPSNPRIDLVCLTVQDKTYTGSTDVPLCQILTGTPTAGATLANLSGAPALPTSSLVLGYVLIPAGATTITNTNISNVAPLAKLAHWAAPMTSVSTSTTLVDGGNYLSTGTNLTHTLPPPSIATQVITVTANNATGCTISTPSGTIVGPGVALGATSIPLGATGASVTLQSNGTNWYVIDGMQDSGWVTPTLGNSWTSYSPTTIQYRLQGNRVQMRGQFTPGGATGTSPFTFPAGYRPAQVVNSFVAAGGGQTATAQVGITTAGVLTVFYPAGSTPVGMDPVFFTVD